MVPSIRPAFAALLLCGLAGCATSGGSSSRQLAYCSQLYQLYFRYHTVITYAHDGQQVRAELALQACKDGSHAAGIETLTALLVRERVTVPPPPSGSGM